MIKTDSIGLIGQHRRDDPKYLDFGDSCMKTSIAVIGGIAEPSLLYNFYLTNEGVIRHPHQGKFKDPKETSRDQLIPLVAALKLRKDNQSNVPMILTLIRKQYRWFINKDFLAPDFQLFMNTCAGIKSSWFTKNIGRMWLKASIYWSAKINPDHELNQIMCICLVMGKDYLIKLCKMHPEWKKNLTDYWSRWRDQPEIGEAFINIISEALK